MLSILRQAKPLYPDAQLELIDECLGRNMSQPAGPGDFARLAGPVERRWGGLECQEAGAELRNGLQGHEKSQYGPLGQGRGWAQCQYDQQSNTKTEERF